jgi:hypothetical protein
LKLRKYVVLCLSLISLIGVNVECSARRSLGRIKYLGFSENGTLEEYRDQDRSEMVRQLNREGMEVREECLGSFEQMKAFIEAAEYPERAYSYVALYAGYPLTTPFWGFNYFCFAIISREKIHEP